jgi:hypothetical protein
MTGGDEPVCKEDDVCKARMTLTSPEELHHAKVALTIAEDVGIFDSGVDGCQVQLRGPQARRATSEDWSAFTQWEADIKAMNDQLQPLINDQVPLPAAAAVDLTGVCEGDSETARVESLREPQTGWPDYNSFFNVGQKRAYDRATREEQSGW